MISLIIAVILIVSLTGISHILLKLGSRPGRGWKLHGLYINPTTVSGYSLFIVVTILGVLVLQYIPLKVLTACNAFTFIVVLALSRFILKEPVDRKKIFAVLLIAMGVVVFNSNFLLTRNLAELF